MIGFPIIAISLLFVGINTSGDNQSLIQETLTLTNATIVIFATLIALLGFKFLTEKGKNKSE